MIRYKTDDADLTRRIDAVRGWREKAAAQTARNRKARAFSGTSIWSQVKPAYMQLQHGKCGYCERYIGTSAGTRVATDVEHFRPKSSVNAGVPPYASEVAAGLGSRVGSASAKGYYLLAYHPWNYLTACKECNSPYKSNYFPVAGKRCVTAADPRQIKGEKAYLIYPLGEIDADPEDLITFEGLVPHARPAKGFDRARGELTIAFFKLAEREELRIERAETIRSVYDELVRAGTLTVGDAQPHASCARAFVRLYDDDRKKAEAIYSAARALLKSVGRL